MHGLQRRASPAFEFLEAGCFDDSRSASYRDFDFPSVYGLDGRFPRRSLRGSVMSEGTEEIDSHFVQCFSRLLRNVEIRQTA